MITKMTKIIGAASQKRKQEEDNNDNNDMHLTKSQQASPSSLLFNDYCSRVSFSRPTNESHYFLVDNMPPTTSQLDDDNNNNSFEEIYQQQVPEVRRQKSSNGISLRNTTRESSQEGAKSAPNSKKQLSFSDTNDNNTNQSKQHHHLSVRFPMAGGHQRMMAPRLSLLGKPIYFSPHKSYQRNTPSMRWKIRLRSFLEQPQGFFPWLYHFSL